VGASVTLGESIALAVYIAISMEMEIDFRDQIFKPDSGTIAIDEPEVGDIPVVQIATYHVK
jgi:hypothetical protein